LFTPEGGDSKRLGMSNYPSRPRFTSEEYFVDKERRKSPSDSSEVSTYCALSDAVPVIAYYQQR
jgi:hypothetical protein